MLSNDDNLGDTYKFYLPCDPSQFNDFIGKLLGKPQTITKFVKGSFDITQKDIENIYCLLTQRVSQQNKSNLLQFSVKLVFDDNSTVTLNSFEDFSTYTEVRPLIVVQAHLSWIFLVTYEDKGVPEKQEIDFSFFTSSNEVSYFMENEDSMPMTFCSEASAVAFRIRHTARTWGADIEWLLTGYTQNLLEKQSKVKKMVQKYSGRLGLLSGFILLISSLITCFYSSSQARINQLSYIKSYLNDMVSMNHKIDFLMQLNATGFWGNYFFSLFVFIIVIFVISVILSIWVAESGAAFRPSHILLTKKSEENKKTADKKYEKKWYSFIASIVVSILIGIITNIIFTFIW